MTDPVVILRIDRYYDGRASRIVPSESYLEFLQTGGGAYHLEVDTATAGDSLDLALAGILDVSSVGLVLIVEVARAAVTEAELAAYCVMLSKGWAGRIPSRTVLSVPSVEDLIHCEQLGSLYTTDHDVVALDENDSYELGRGGLLHRSGVGLIRAQEAIPDLPRVGASDLLLRFGHFSSQMSEMKLHGNTIPDIETLREVGYLSEWQRLVTTVDEDLRKVTRGRPFALHPIDWFEGELSALAHALCNDPSRHMWYPGMEMPDRVAIAVTLSSAPLSRDVHRYLARKRQIPEDVELIHWNILGGDQDDVEYSVEVSHVAGTFSPWSCPYCEQDAPLEGDGSDSRSLGPLHPKIFWDLVSWCPESLDHRHWRSPLTPNHFNLRLHVEPIFSLFATSLAIRMINSLELHGIKRSWIDGIVCTAGAEIQGLVPELARLLDLDADSVVVMDGDLRALARGPGSHPDLQDAVDTQREFGKNILASNVIIVDQAAHHLTTHAALRKVADCHGARTLAFAVFVDRTGQAHEVAAELQEREHFVPLYSWPCRPVTAGSCSCGDLVELISP